MVHLELALNPDQIAVHVELAATPTYIHYATGTQTLATLYLCILWFNSYQIDPV